MEVDRDELVEKNLGLVRVVMKNLNISLFDQDVFQIGCIGLIKAAKTYNQDLNIKFTSYSCRCITNEILMSFRKNKRHLECISIDEPIRTDSNGNDLSIMDMIGEKDLNIERLGEKELIQQAMECLSEKEKQIIELIYFKNELKERQIAEIIGNSQSYINRLKSKALLKLRNKIEFFYKPVRRVENIMAKITKEQLIEECLKVACENQGKIKKCDFAEIAMRYGMTPGSVEFSYYNFHIKDALKEMLANKAAVIEEPKAAVEIKIQAEDTAPIPDSEYIKLIGKKQTAQISFYIASKLENKEQVRATARILGWYGWKWTFDWTSVNEEDKDRLPELLTEGVMAADVVIILLPGELGTFTELGIALGSGKKIYLCSESDNEFTFGDKVCPFPLHPNVTRVTGLPMDVIERVLSDYGLIKVGESALME